MSRRHYIDYTSKYSWTFWTFLIALRVKQTSAVKRIFLWKLISWQTCKTSLVDPNRLVLTCDSSFVVCKIISLSCILIPYYIRRFSEKISWLLSPSLDIIKKCFSMGNHITWLVSYKIFFFYRFLHRNPACWMSTWSLKVIFPVLFNNMLSYFKGRTSYN